MLYDNGGVRTAEKGICRLFFFFRRQETSTKPQRTETTVVFLPDVWSVMPNGEEYENITKLYEEALQTKLAPPKKEVASPKKDKMTSLKKDAMEEENTVS